MNEFTVHLEQIKYLTFNKQAIKTKRISQFFNEFYKNGEDCISIRLHRYADGDSSNKLVNINEYLIEVKETNQIVSIKVQLSKLDLYGPIKSLEQYLENNKDENISPWSYIQIKSIRKIISIHKIN